MLFSGPDFANSFSQSTSQNFINPSAPYYYSHQPKQTKLPSNVYASLSETYTCLFSQASRSLMQLLEEFEYMFERNKINFKVKQHHGMLMRVLTPHELLSQHHIIDNKDMFDDGGEWEGEYGILTQCKYRHREKLSKTKIQNMKEKLENYQPAINKELSSSQVSPSNYLTMKTQVKMPLYGEHEKSERNFDNQNKGGSKPMLPLKLEKQLARWVITSLINNNPVKIKDVANEAIKLARDFPRFSGSTGWAHRFLMRYPKTKQMMMYMKGGQIEHAFELKNEALLEVDNVVDGVRYVSERVINKKNGYGVDSNELYEERDRKEESESDYEVSDSKLESEENKNNKIKQEDIYDEESDDHKENT